MSKLTPQQIIDLFKGAPEGYDYYLIYTPNETSRGLCSKDNGGRFYFQDGTAPTNIDDWEVICKPVTSPTYTQSMADNGELPSVGMECNFSVIGGLWQNVLVDYISETVIVITDGNSAQGSFLIKDSRFNPVSPPPIELIDGKAYQFDDKVLPMRYGTYDNGGSTAVFWVKGRAVYASDCTNIKLLTVAD